MNQNQIVFIVDAGNTLIKVGRFLNGNLMNVVRFSYNELDLLSDYFNLEVEPAIFVSSVVSENRTNEIVSLNKHTFLFHRLMKLPIQIKYESPNTLGLDRLCNVVAGFSMSNKTNSLIIDVGTCVKFDFIDSNGNYLGGSISPGIELRFKSMNDYTGNLPLILDKSKTELIGSSTIHSMKSGVMNGIQSEINQFIHFYSQQYPGLTIFMTGGDAVYFDFSLKNNTFVDENLTLKGLYQIYMFNAK